MAGVHRDNPVANLVQILRYIKTGSAMVWAGPQHGNGLGGAQVIADDINVGHGVRLYPHRGPNDGLFSINTLASQDELLERPSSFHGRGADLLLRSRAKTG